MWLTTFLLAAALSGHTAEPARVPLAKVVNAEKLISTQFASMYPDEPWFLIGPARGFYLDGVGAVFSAEVNLATGPAISPFKPTITKEEIAHHKEKKESRLPMFRARMLAIVASSAAALDSLPKNEEFVLSVTLLRYPWETTTGVPSQIIMRLPCSKLAEIQQGTLKPEAAIRVQEY